MEQETKRGRAPPSDDSFERKPSAATVVRSRRTMGDPSPTVFSSRSRTVGAALLPQQRLLQLLILLAVTLSNFGTLVTYATQEGDALYSMMQRWSVEFPGWRYGGDPCHDSPIWKYVSCRGEFVVELNVSNTGISGELPPEIGNLVHLEVLDVSNFAISEDLSDSNSPFLLFPRNTLTGTFPDTLANCVSLQSFNASHMAWDVEFPSVIMQLSQLQELSLSNSSLKGSLPDDFYNSFPNLRSLYIGENNIKGSLLKIANFKNLILLAIANNDFLGTIPSEIGNLVNLQYFNCHTCNLYGQLPDSLSQLTKLRNLTLHQNSFTGQIPTSWKGMSSMQNFRIDQNYLSGGFPNWVFDSWPSLDYLYVTKNRLSGPSPNLTFLEVNYNVSGVYEILKWECNYLNGHRPCLTTTECSDDLETRINSTDFDFDKNCYNDTSAKTNSKVFSDCGSYHPTTVDCTQFYQLLANGQCLPCPSNERLTSGITGQNCVCEIDPKSKHSGVSIGGVVGGALAIVFVFLLLIIGILYKRRKHFSFLDIFTVKERQDNTPWEVPPGVQRFTVAELARITQDFSDNNMIGQGGFGKVFVGTLDDGRMVAIKRATTGGLQGTAEFRNEVSLLSRLHHRHLVRLEGFCDDDGFQILIYEYMRKGNLHAHLLGQLTNRPLNSFKRLEIAYGVAQGLEYLHSFADPPVIHRDVKPSNILLDDNMVAKLSDFGISKVSPEYDTHVSTRPAGTAGYLDPDYFMRRQLTSASDVYAYGVVLLELVTGQEAIDQSRLEEFNLIEWVKKRFRTSGIVAVIDPLIEQEYSPESYTILTKLGLQCASFDRLERPTMKSVLAALEPLMVSHGLDRDGKGASKKSRKGSHIADDNDYTVEQNLLDHTSRSNESDVTTNIELIAQGHLGPR